MNKRLLYPIILFSVCILFMLSNSVISQKNSKSWQYYLKKGKIQFNSEMYDYSLFNMKIALTLNHRLYEAYNYIAKIYIIKNMKIEAMKYYKKSLLINAKQPDIQNDLGELYEFFAEYKNSFKYYTNALKYNNNHIYANLNISRYYYKNNNKKLALYHYNISKKQGALITKNLKIKALKAEKLALDYMQENTPCVEKYFKTTQIYHQQTMKFFKERIDHYTRLNNYTAIKTIKCKLSAFYFKLTITYYQNIIFKNPAGLESYMKIIGIYRKFKENINAVKYLKKIINIKPDNVYAFETLGHLYFTRKINKNKSYSLKMSLYYFNKALALNPKKAENYHMISQIYYAMGKKVLAQKYQNKANSLE